VKLFGDFFVKEGYIYRMDKSQIEKAYLVGLARKSTNKSEVKESLNELAELTKSAGGTVTESMIQTRSPDPKYYIGKGFVQRLKEQIADDGTNLIIFDDQLSPAQQRNLEEVLEVKVIDRPILILDIFALHARSSAAKLQVELAQLEYMLPRLTGAWTHFSRQYGGIGAKGPGETQLETDRRRVRKKISHLKKEIKRLGQQRETQRKSRQDLFKISLIGYTNAGKSTLFNRLTKSEVTTANALFTTLDSTTRMMSTGYPDKIIFTDTVGFIRKLPHQLVASFKSTLEEVTSANLLLHVVSYCDPDYQKKITATEKVLGEIGANNIDTLLIFNKIDKIENIDTSEHSNLTGFYLSALRGDGLESLRQELSLKLQMFFHRS
jgi:GTP-binding protein HflX